MQLFQGESLNVIAQSRWYETPAYPAGSGGSFVNGCALIHTELAPEQVMAALHRIEAGLGRERRDRWAARTIDLDLIAMDDLVRPDTAVQARWRALAPEEQAKQAPEQLILPHPRLEDRSFVLYPMRDIVPDWVHPVTGQGLEAMIAALPARIRREITVI